MKNKESKGKVFFTKLPQAEKDAILEIINLETNEKRLKLKSMSDGIKKSLEEIIEKNVRGWKNDN